jgi:hypothetical protein
MTSSYRDANEVPAVILPGDAILPRPAVVPDRQPVELVVDGAVVAVARPVNRTREGGT